MDHPKDQPEETETPDEVTRRLSNLTRRLDDLEAEVKPPPPGDQPGSAV